MAGGRQFVRVRDGVRGALLAAFVFSTLFVGCSDSSRVLEAAAAIASQYSDASAAGLPSAVDGAEGSSGFESGPAAGGLDALAEPARGAPPEAPSGPRTYYQYTDGTGSVRFVSTLEEVPAEWRDRAGSVELSGKPPTSPADRRADFDRRRQRARAVLAANPATRSRSGLEAKLYYATWCGYCRKAKAHLDAAGVEYELRDVDDPSIAAELRAKTGSGGIPVLDVGGELVRGYDPSGIDRLIAKL